MILNGEPKGTNIQRLGPWRKILFSLAPLVIIFAIAEVSLRVYDWSRGASAHARAFWFWGFVQDRLLGYRLVANLDLVMAGSRSHLDTNAEGFRDNDLPLESPPRRLIVAMGESSTWGTGSTSRQTTWPHQLQTILRHRDPRFTVFNAGTPGYTVVENLQLLNHRLLKYRPEAVVYMGLRNDVQFYMKSLSEAGDLNFYSRRLAPLPDSGFRFLMQSSLVALVATRLGNFVQYDRQIPDGEPRPGFTLTSRGQEILRDQVALMKLLCDRHGVKLLWVDQPINPSKEDADIISQARAVLRHELFQNGIPLFDAQKVYDFRRFPLIDDVHFDDPGAAHLASILAPQMLAEMVSPNEQASSNPLKP